jgi:hypothetical protein
MGTRATFVLMLLVGAACGPSVQGGGDDDDGCGVACTGVCHPELGCAACWPGIRFCDGDDVRECTADGTGGAVVETCASDQVCAGGHCVTECELAVRQRSNIGCEYWAVDLDNEYSQFNDAAGEQFAVAIANTSDHTVSITVEQNDAEPGAPRRLSTVTTATVAPNALTVIDLPRREVDGSLQGRGEGPGTMLSSRAYRITTNYPVVAYQFNPIVQSFSNGASLLIPTSGLDRSYYVLGWPTANPISGPFEIPGIPDHSFVTVVGVTDAPIRVEVRLGGPIVAGGGIPATAAGHTVEIDLGAFDVLNLESDGIPGDLSGTRVVANGPVAVFSGGERAIVPGAVMPPAPAGWDGDLCCTEHFEQQLFPRSSLGKAFVTTRSPVRSRSESNPEADVWRVLATEPGTVVTTTLPSPYHQFTLAEGQWAEFWSVRDFILTSNQPVVVAQYLVSQQYVESPDVGGDPEFILFPPAEQFKEEYIFLTPPTFQRDYCVIAAPANAQIELDGASLGEYSPRCSRHDAGVLGDVPYVAIRCELDDGVHRVKSDLPVGVTVYGYYNVGSYGYPAGAKLERINVD